MAIPAIAITILCYIAAAASCARGKDYSHSIMWLAYAIANAALLWYEIQKQRSE